MSLRSGLRNLVAVANIAIAVFLIAAQLPVAEQPATAFANPAFERSYAHVSPQQQQLLWGGPPIATEVETFVGLPGNRRVVQYFERGRMELDDRTTTPVTERVSFGNLVTELVTGDVQIGATEHSQQTPAQVPLFSTKNGASYVTYADFTDIALTPSPNRIGERLTQWVGPGVGVYSGPTPAEIVLDTYDAASSHNLPHVTVEWLRSAPFGIDWHAALGDPISEPYWVHSNRGNGVSLVQLFERRVVIYTPDLPTADRFALTNSGTHYVRWRYSNGTAANAATPTSPTAARLDGASDSRLTLPPNYRSVVLAAPSGSVDLDIAPDGRLTVLTADGQVVALNPNRPADDPVTIVGELQSPRAFAWVGSQLFVLERRGLLRFEAAAAGSKLSEPAVITAAGVADVEAQLVPGADGSLLVIVAGHRATTTDLANFLEPGVYQLDAGSTTLGAQRILCGAAPITAVIDVAEGLWCAGAGSAVWHDAEHTGTTTLAIDVTGTNEVRRLLLNAPDGTTGDPRTDLFALTSSKLIQLHSAATVGGTTTFINGFDDARALTAGLDGTLYILDGDRISAIIPPA